MGQLVILKKMMPFKLLRGIGCFMVACLYLFAYGKPSAPVQMCLCSSPNSK